MPKRESLYHKYPDYRVDLEPSGERVRVRLGGELIAVFGFGARDLLEFSELFLKDLVVEAHASLN